MSQKYRVVCSENQQLYPNRTFIDIYPADNRLIHDSILQMRRTVNPQVDSLLSGIILTDFGNGNIFLQYEKVYNFRLKTYQEQMIKRLEPAIRQTFADMQSRGKDRTLEVSLRDMAVLFDLHARSGNTPLSAREDMLIRENERHKHFLAKKQELIRRQAKAPYAAAPHVLLAWKQAQYRGD